MTLDELVELCAAHRSDSAVDGLAKLLAAWKTSSADVDALAREVERYFGHTWIEDQSVHHDIYMAWSRFKQSAIDTIGGQTMNERLYYFSLFPRFDACSSDRERDEIYAKLNASASNKQE